MKTTQPMKHPETTEPPFKDVDIEFENVPETLGSELVLHLSGSDSATEQALDLRLLSYYGTGADYSICITTESTVDEIIRQYGSITDAVYSPALGIVDTASKLQSVPMLYQSTPILLRMSPPELASCVLRILNWKLQQCMT